MTTVNPTLTTMIDQLTVGWSEPVEYAVAEPSHTPGCRGVMAAMTIGQLRHFECQCPRRFETRKESRWRMPLILELFEASHSLTGDRSDGQPTAKKSEAPLPQQLAEYDFHVRSINLAAGIICSDWRLEVGENIESRLEAIRLEVGARCWTETDDAAHVLALPVVAALEWLGYREKPRELRCGDCGHALAVGQASLLCTGCGGSWGLSAAAEALLLGSCEAGHAWTEANTRVTSAGKRQCRACAARRARSRRARAAPGDGLSQPPGPRGYPDSQTAC